MKPSLVPKSGTQQWWQYSSRTSKHRRVHFHGDTPDTSDKDTRHPRQRRNQRGKAKNARCERCGASILGVNISGGLECKCGTRLHVKSTQDKDRAMEEARKCAERNAADVKVQNQEFWNEERKQKERERRQWKEENRRREKKEDADSERQQRSQAKQSQYFKRQEDTQEQERQRAREEKFRRRQRQAREQAGSHWQRARKESEGSSHRDHDSPSSRHNDRAYLDFYALLGVSRWATQAEVQKAARRKRIETHPDGLSGRNVSSLMFEALVERAKIVGQAADVLCDPLTRLKYDNQQAAFW